MAPAAPQAEPLKPHIHEMTKLLKVLLMEKSQCQCPEYEDSDDEEEEIRDQDHVLIDAVSVSCVSLVSLLSCGVPATTEQQAVRERPRHR